MGSPQQPITTKRTSSSQERMRTFLAIWTAILTLLVIIAYLDTKDIRVLLASTIVAIAVGYVYAFYFRRRR